MNLTLPKDNKGNAIIITSIVVFIVIILGVSGYLGYSYYQKELEKQRYIKLNNYLVKVQEIQKKTDTSQNRELLRSTPGSQEYFRGFQNLIDNFEKGQEEIEKLEKPEIYQEEINKCIDARSNYVSKVSVIFKRILANERTNPQYYVLNQPEYIKEVTEISTLAATFDRECRDLRDLTEEIKSKLEEFEKWKIIKALLR